MGSTLELSPLPRSISLFRIRQIADAGPDRDDLDFFNLADDFKSILSQGCNQSLPVKAGSFVIWRHSLAGPL